MICLIFGFWLGGIKGRKVVRRATLKLRTNSLHVLQSKSRFVETESRNIDIERKAKLRQDTQLQLKESVAAAERSNRQAQRSELHVKKLQQDLITFRKNGFTIDNFEKASQPWPLALRLN